MRQRQSNFTSLAPGRPKPGETPTGGRARNATGGQS
jgi:hypothetical protein